MVFNTGSLISVKVVPDSSPLEVSFTRKYTENNGRGVGLAYYCSRRLCEHAACSARASLRVGGWCAGS